MAAATSEHVYRTVNPGVTGIPDDSDDPIHAPLCGYSGDETIDVELGTAGSRRSQFTWLKGILRLDMRISQGIQSLSLGCCGDIAVLVFALMCSTLGSPAMLITFFIAAYMGYSSGGAITIPTVLTYGAAIIINALATTVLKPFFCRVRPMGPIAPRLIDIRFLEHNYSFPSGDSMQAGALGVWLVWISGQPYFLMLVPCVMFARVYFGFHWATDTLVGGALGILLTVLVIMYSYPMILAWTSAHLQNIPAPPGQHRSTQM